MGVVSERGLVLPVVATAISLIDRCPPGRSLHTVSMDTRYETWFFGNVRLVPKDPSRPLNAGGDYSNVALVQDGPPIAHAVASGASVPECGSTSRLLPHGHPWTDPIPEHWVRCPECLPDLATIEAKSVIRRLDIRPALGLLPNAVWYP